MTDFDDGAARRGYVNAGAQADLRLITLSHFESTFSLGFAVAAGEKIPRKLGADGLVQADVNMAVALAVSVAAGLPLSRRAGAARQLQAHPAARDPARGRGGSGRRAWRATL